MRKTVKKWFWVWNWKKEEEWLNAMAAKGLCLAGVGFFRYDFVESLPGEYQIRMEMLGNRVNHPESERYLEFLEETNAEHVGSLLRWVYLRKKTSEGPFDLFSDNTSKIKHLGRIEALLLPLCAMNLYNGCYNLFLYFTHDLPVSLVAALLCLLAGLLLAIGVYKTHRQKSMLKKEQMLFE